MRRWLSAAAPDAQIAFLEVASDNTAAVPLYLSGLVANDVEVGDQRATIGIVWTFLAIGVADALVCACTALMHPRISSIPEVPEFDDYGLPMEIVHADKNGV